MVVVKACVKLCLDFGGNTWKPCYVYLRGSVLLLIDHLFWAFFCVTPLFSHLLSVQSDAKVTAGK